MHIWDLQRAHIWVHYSVTDHQRTADTPADGGRADTPAGGGQADTRGGAILRMGTHSHAMGKGRIRREPQRGGRERCINTKKPRGAKNYRYKFRGLEMAVINHGRYKFITTTATIPKRLRNGRFNSKTAVR
jgi:hypothetical protein